MKLQRSKSNAGKSLRYEATIKEYQLCYYRPNKLSIPKLAQKHGIPEHTLQHLLKPITHSIDEFN